MKIKTIEIICPEIYATKEFYHNNLGFRIHHETSDKISFETGSSILTFIHGSQAQARYHFAFLIPDNTVSNALEWLSSRVTLIRNPADKPITNFKSWNARSIYFYDNNGNILEFIARFDLQITDTKKFSASSILCLNEVGLVVDEPLSFSEKLIQELSIDYFEKGPKTDDFVVLGDNEGLLIISGVNRNWFPTEHQAEKYYLRTILSINGEQKEVRMLQ